MSLKVELSSLIQDYFVLFWSGFNVLVFLCLISDNLRRRQTSGPNYINCISETEDGEY